MKILVLQHIACETPGYIKDLMNRDNVEIFTIQLDENEKIPKNIEIFDGMLCMGGPMDTWMENQYPWLKEEKKRIKEFVVDLEKPFLGFCLGCQLLGEVIGGEVIKSSPSEIGILDIDINDEKLNDKLFSQFPNKIKALQWHSYEVAGLEKNKHITLLGSSPTTKYQLFKYKNHAYGIQFHIEIKDNTVKDWGCVPEYIKALEDSLGPNALEKFQNSASENMKNMNQFATIIYHKFKELIKK